MLDKRTLVTQALQYLQQLHFVKWDRWMDCYDRDGSVIFYGWIDREQDSYKDFVEVDLFAITDAEKYKIVYSTSSEKYSAKIGRILGMEEEHIECKRIETLFPKLPNVIKLETKPIAVKPPYCVCCDHVLKNRGYQIVHPECESCPACRKETNA